VFRHAISLDERRSKFKQNTWNQPTYKESLLAASDRVQAANSEANANTEHARHPQVNGREKKDGKVSQKQLEREYSDLYEAPTDVEEVSAYSFNFLSIPGLTNSYFSGLVRWVSLW
jgi:uncharacterized protein (DUF2235 family)